MQKHSRGFTLIELLVVIVIIGILVAIALPNFIKIKEKAFEAQVKANLRIIWIALERYGTEHDGKYPSWLLGGDPSDPNTTVLAARFNIYCPPYCGDGDSLLLYGYLASFPENPFVAAASGLQFSIPPLTWRNADGSAIPGFNEGDGIVCHSSPTDHAIGGGSNAGRRVGGPGSKQMFDVTEGLYGCTRNGTGGGPARAMAPESSTLTFSCTETKSLTGPTCRFPIHVCTSGLSCWCRWWNWSPPWYTPSWA